MFMDAKFQSTLPREERHMRGLWRPFYSDFNPRSHERSDPRETLRRNHDTNNFNPRSHERSDREHPRLFYIRQNFNPRSHERSDPDMVEVVLTIPISIHAPTRGATAILHKKFVYFYTIPTINI